MWTHRWPYRTPLLTRTSIARHAQIGLYRALNIGNIIAFVGSGATVAFGRPTWGELVRRAHKRTKRLADELLEELAANNADADQALREDLKELLDTVAALAAHKEMPGETLKLLAEACENIVRRIDEFSRNRPVAARTAREKLREHLREAIERKHPKHDRERERQDREERLGIDPIHDAFELLGIRRFLTINYDLEIERFLKQRRGFRAPALGASFDDLLPPTSPDASQHPTSMGRSQGEPATDSSRTRVLDYRATATDALGRTAFSTTLRDESVGELVTFACMPRGGDPQVFHLHGRVDDPARFIYSERDYQRAYLRLDNTRRTFHEALDTLFLGNDVIFIGVGMNEGDLLRPLRQFVAEERTPDTSTRRMFALLPYDGEKKALEQALELKIRYGVLSIYFGEDVSYYRKRLFDRLLKEPDPAHLEGQLSELRREICDAREAAPRAKIFKDESVARISEGTPPAELVRLLLLRGVPKRLSLIAPMGRKLLSCLKDTAGFPSPGEIEACNHQVMTNALCQSMHDLALGKEKWWRDWNKDALEAKARYPRVVALPPPQGAPGEATPVVWIRHQAEYTYPPGVSQPSALLRFAKAEADRQYGACSKARRRILRLAGPRGCGKGVLFQELLRPAEASAAPGATGPKENWERLFPEPHGYSGAFFAHVSFSPEFTSVIGGLVRFIAGRTGNADDVRMAEEILRREAEDRKRRDLPASDQPRVKHSGDFEWYPRLLRDPSSGTDDPRPLWPDDAEPDRLTQLRLVLGRFAEFKAGRVLICLAGLDRLCDQDGVAYHPMHRAFFGILVGDEYSHLPLDIVLIAGSPDTPIHFLSALDRTAGDDGVPTRREPSAAGGNDDPAAAFEAPRERLQPWARLPRLPLDERVWLQRSRRWYLSCLALKDAPVLQGFLTESVALDTWLSLCAGECFGLKTGRAKLRAAYRRVRGAAYSPRPNWLWQTREDWIANLEGAAKRGGLRDLLDEMFLTYRQLDDEQDRLPRSAILRHLCLFTLPIEPEVLLACPQVVAELVRAAPHLQEAQAFGPEWTAILQRHLDRLVRRGLVIRVCVPSTASPGLRERSPLRQRYVLHAQLREYLARQMKFTIPDGGERNYHDVSLYCAQPRDLPTPSEAHYRLIAGVVESLVSTCRSRLEWFYKKRSHNAVVDKDPPSAQAILALPQMIRAAFNILRDSFSIGSLARLPRLESDLDEREEPYEVYRSWLRHILNLAIAMEEVGGKPDGNDEYRDDGTLRHYLAQVLREERFPLRDPLYQNEIIWLYNERALIGLYQGRLYDALPSFGRALRFTRYGSDRDSQDTADDAHLAAERRVCLNLAIAEIEYGQIQRARQRLDALVARARQPGLRHPSMTPILALGYIGLCDHLGGQLESAIRTYRSVIAVAERRQLLRTASIFHRHCADALRVEGNLGDAEKHLQLSIFAAAGEEQKDLHAHTLIAKARLARDSGRPERLKGALELLDQAEQYAEDMGLVKARVEALKVRAELILAQGETEYAGRLAARAIALASRDGMRLRRLAALVTYARVLRARSQTSLAKTVLDRASKEASRLRYRLKAELADRELRELGSQVQSAPETFA